MTWGNFAERTVCRWSHLCQPEVSALVWFGLALAGYSLLLIWGAWTFYRIQRDLWTLQADIDKDAEEIRKKRRVGRPTTDPIKLGYEDDEQEARSLTHRILDTSSRIMLPLQRAIGVTFLGAPTLFAYALTHLAAVQQHSRWAGLSDVTVSTYDAAAFIAELMLRGVTFEFADAFHIEVHLYQHALDNTLISVFAWPLEAIVALYFYSTLFQIAGLRKQVSRWLLARNEIVTHLEAESAKGNFRIHFEELQKPVRLRYFGAPAAGISKNT